MKAYFKRGSSDSRCFNLNRYKDKHGKWYELRPNKLPRGDVWYRLSHLEWQTIGLAIQKIGEDCLELLEEIKGELTEKDQIPRVQ